MLTRVAKEERETIIAFNEAEYIASDVQIMHNAGRKNVQY